MSREERDNKFVKEILKSGDWFEALEWLTNAPLGVHRSIAAKPEHELVLLIQKLYDLGAKVVMAVDIKAADSNYESTEHLVVKLPDDPEARSAIFDFERLREEEMGYDPDDADEDIGQLHIRILFPFWID